MDWLKEHKLLVFAVIVAGLFFVYSALKSPSEMTKINEGILSEETFETERAESDRNEEVSAVMMADVKGAVVNPGVYLVTEGDRIRELIEKAGGVTEEADVTTINFAMRVTDEMVVYIPKKGEAVSGGSSVIGNNVQALESNKVNLNRASSQELETLPGIGPSRAEAIIEYRETQGPFKTIEDIKKISGIGDKTFEKLMDHISVK